MMDRIRNEHIRGKAQGQNGEEGEMMVIFKRRLLKFELPGKRGKKKKAQEVCGCCESRQSGAGHVTEQDKKDWER